MANQFISLTQAIQMTKKYRADRNMILADAYKDKDILPLSETFSRDEFDKVMAQSGCTGLRVYFGMDDYELIKVIVVGVDANGQDILPPAQLATLSGGKVSALDDSMIIDQGLRCPTNCPPPSVLNQ